MVVIAGRFRERCYGFDGRSLNELTSGTRSVGSVIVISRTSIHDMECLDGRGTTLHLYAPTPAQMRLYDVSRRETVVVGDGHGAWLPTEHTLSRTRWVR